MREAGKIPQRPLQQARDQPVAGREVELFLDLDGPSLQVALTAHGQEGSGEDHQHRRFDEPLDNDQPDDSVRLCRDRAKFVPEPDGPPPPPPTGPDFRPSSRSRKRITRHAAFFSTYGAVLPRLNSPKRRL